MCKREIEKDMVKETIYSGNTEASHLDLDIVPDTKVIIAAVNTYLKLNYSKLYSENNLEAAFKKAKENKDIENKMLKVINNFIYN